MIGPLPGYCRVHECPLDLHQYEVEGEVADPPILIFCDECAEARDDVVATSVALTEAVDFLALRVPDYHASEPFDLEERISVYVTMLDAAAKLRETLKWYEEHTADVMPTFQANLEHVPGVRTVKKHGKGGTVVWDDDAIDERVVARAADERLVNPKTGEFEREGAAVLRTLRKVAKVEWRVGSKGDTEKLGLHAIGIDPNAEKLKYTTRGNGYSLEIVRG